MRKLFQVFAFLLAVLLAGYSATLRAEDIDVYVDNTSNNAVPNLLFVIDTGANFSSSAAACTYSSGGAAPTLSGTAGGIEQCALVNAIESLPNGTVNIGIMVNNNNNFATDTRASTDLAYHETCSGTYGGCLVRKLTLMDATGKANLVNFIKSWKTSGSNSATEFNVKSGGDRTANAMQESWAYYNGKIGMSGKNYGTSLLASGCQKNFLIYIGNAFNNSGGPADGGSTSPGGESGGALAAAQVGASDAQKLKISETVSFTPNTCGVSSITATTNASNWSENWADEWARLMYQQDGGNAAATGSVQNIITYTIGVVDDSGCKADYPALLTTMAKYGGGKYFKTSNSTDLTAALGQILNEVQAVNSVFSSASLPVSVNAQGTYLNQIFLGMFRPDSSGNPRWMGNLKQFQLVKNSSGELVLGDANGASAISSAGTGFISPSAVSYWTYKNTAVEPDLNGGFFRNDAKGTPATTYDSPDGEVVEKGGVAQQLRKENLTATFSGAATAIGTSTNPRRLYTYCPAGTSCVAALTDASNEFSTANSNINAAAFGTSATVSIASIVRSGTTATVTTTGNHGLTGTPSVVISNSNQSEYNGTKTVAVTGVKTFTFAVPDYPTNPATGTYTASIASGTPVSISSITRSSSATGSSNSETATITTSAAHGFTTANNITISGASPSSFNFSGTPTTASGTTITVPIAITPPATATNTYTVQFNPSSNPSVNLSGLSKSGSTGTGTTSAAHGFWVGQSVTITGADLNGSTWNGTYVIETVPSTTTFTFNKTGSPGTASLPAAVQPSLATKTITSLTRVGTTATVTATATLSGADKFFGNAIGQTRVVNIAKSAGTATNETAYEQSGVTITCTNSVCSTFTFSVPTSPSLTATGTMTVGLTGANGTITSLSRSGSTATAVVTMAAGTFVTGNTITITPTGTVQSAESAYTGSWSITCTVCNSTTATFTFGPVTLSPTTPATGSNMQVYAGSSSPDRDTVIKWVRGLDSQGDENSPNTSTIKVRESIHGDVLHSRPTVINYGDSRGIVAFYGANDGIFRAVNGNQTGNISNVPPGGELWGLILPDHYPFLYRQMTNTPELKFPSTILSTAKAKDYFVDGPTGVYQKLNADNTINTAILYMTMRRGGRFLYALDVSTPTAPTVLWRIGYDTAGFSELGQTWSRPRLTLLQNLNDPVLVFGAGYDSSQDSEPPGTDTMGRGIYVVNAATGALIWSASSSCGTSTATCKQVNEMTYSIPTEIAFVDRDADGRTDKFYFGDMGGNVWRADVNTADTASWTVTKLAALGCATGTCASGTTPRKFFFPPSVLSIKAAGAVGSYDAISLASGDREHPLKSTATGSSYGVADKFFMIKDAGTSVGGATTNNLSMTTLVNATSTPWTGTGDGFYISFVTGEKSVNAPLAVNGFIFFSTNRPIDRSITCAANLGEAKAYAVSPFDAATTTNTLSGGGLPPSAVSGLVNITTTVNGTSTNSVQKFCIGCGISGSQLGGTSTGTCNSALQNCDIQKVIPKNLKRTYWYRK